MPSQVDSIAHVLVADDEHVIADTLALILRAAGWNTRAVYSGEAAVKAARELPPRVFISDVVMGEMSGIEAATLIRQMCPTCDVLLISGQASTADLLRNSDFELLAKPVHPKIVLDRIALMLSKS